MIVLNDVAKKYDNNFNSTYVLQDLYLHIKKGELVCILGKSGCGKSTLLNLLAGYMKADRGEIYVDGELVKGPSKSRGVVFQEHALFPWYTVYQNIVFGPKITKLPEPDKIAEKYLKMIGLEEYKDYYPSQLSGGMKQRVGIARAFANNPKILLMDEPFSALDPNTRQKMRTELLKIWEKSGTTIVFITHDVSEAVYLGSRVVMLGEGHIKVDQEINLEGERDIHSEEFIRYVQLFEQEMNGKEKKACRHF